MADWMFCLGHGDDLNSTPQERRNLSATSSASAPKERVLLRGQLSLGNRGDLQRRLSKPSYPRTDVQDVSSRV